MRFRIPTESDLEAAPRGASGGKSGMTILGQPVKDCSSKDLLLFTQKIPWLYHTSSHQRFYSVLLHPLNLWV